LSYRLIVHVSSTNASAYTIKFDNFSVSPYSTNAVSPSGVLAAKLTVVGIVNHTANGNWQNVAFDTVEINNSGMVSGSTIVITEAGYYFCQASIGFNSAVGSAQGVRFTINGTADTRSEISSSTFSSKYNVQQMYYLEVGDVVRIQGLQSSGGTVAYDNTSDTSLCVFKIAGGAGAINSTSVIAIGFDSASSAITAGSTNINFTETFDNTSSFDGTAFTAPETGTYYITGNLDFTASLRRIPELWKDTGSGYALVKRFGPDITSSTHYFGGTEELNKGDKIVIRVDQNGGTLSSSSTAHWIHISKFQNSAFVAEGGGGGGGASDFTDLGDVPSSYSGEALKLVRVNAAEDALEFTAPVSGISGLTDNRMVKADGTDTVQNTGFTIDDNNIIDFQPGQIHSTIQTLTDATNISWNLNANQVAQVTLAGNRTLDNPTNLKSGAYYSLIVKQDATGSRTLAYGTAYKFFGGVTPVLSTTANAVDIITFISDGTNMFGSIQRGFA
jgi:hypothetical protein